jgi:hypothetical protein
MIIYKSIFVFCANKGTDAGLKLLQGKVPVLCQITGGLEQRGDVIPLKSIPKTLAAS